MQLEFHRKLGNNLNFTQLRKSSLDSKFGPTKYHR